MVDREGRALLWQLSDEVRNAVQTPYARSNVALFGNGHMGGRRCPSIPSRCPPSAAAIAAP